MRPPIEPQGEAAGATRAWRGQIVLRTLGAAQVLMAHDIGIPIKN